MIETDAIRAMLEARLQELAGEVERLEGEAKQPLDSKWEEQANQLEEVATAEGLEAVRVEEAQQIHAALGRIADGSYGICRNCGDAIAPARLEALPTATLCIGCAS